MHPLLYGLKRQPLRAGMDYGGVNMNPWQTEDDCTVCGHAGMIFKPEAVEPALDLFGDSTIEVRGMLCCPACGSEDLSYADEYMIPDSEIGLTGE
jgi:hypothetical protein